MLEPPPPTPSPGSPDAPSRAVVATAGGTVFIPGFGRPGHDIIQTDSGPVWAAFSTRAEMHTPLVVDVTYDVQAKRSPPDAPTRVVLRWHEPIARCDYETGPRAGRFTLREDARHLFLTVPKFDDSPSLVDGVHHVCGEDTLLSLLRAFSIHGPVVESPGKRIDGRATVLERGQSPDGTVSTRDTLTLDAKTSLPIERELSLRDGSRLSIRYQHWVIDPSIPLPDASTTPQPFPDATTDPVSPP